ncbi:hypothetical protein [Bacillus thuringiensis]|uniref:Uncharacterized protein n=1 Tax=Bacillus thuringiensis serovar andalousiensis TaxID=257985 RepID=A0A6H0TPT4_BACTU|nr:hypothetical protein [Bacillus thuringiensis]QIW22457.1 hypothetical protein EVG22_31210 [Bacillus thuringiensis serovar andalousiensis]
MFSKQKMFIFVFLMGLIVSIFPTNSAYAVRPNMPTAAEVRINDIEGNPIVFGKKYILYTDRYNSNNKFGLSYESWNGTHYPIAYKTSDYYGTHKIRKGNIDYYGTPVIFSHIDNRNGGTSGPGRGGRLIKNNDQVSMYMPAINKYIKAPNRGWLSFTSNRTEASYMTVEKTGSNKLRLQTGSADFYYDRMGQPTDSHNANQQNSYYNVKTYFVLQSSDLAGSDANKYWGESWRFPSWNYYFVPVEG